MDRFLLICFLSYIVCPTSLYIFCRTIRILSLFNTLIKIRIEILLILINQLIFIIPYFCIENVLGQIKYDNTFLLISFVVTIIFILSFIFTILYLRNRTFMHGFVTSYLMKVFKKDRKNHTIYHLFQFKDLFLSKDNLELKFLEENKYKDRI